MKTLTLIFFTSLFFCSTKSLFSQSDTITTNNCFDTVEVAGFYVFVYTKSEIKELAKNKTKRENGKPFNISVGDEYREFFIPIDSIGKGKTFSFILNDLLTKNKRDIYIEYANLDYYSFNDYNLGCLRSFKAMSEWPKFISNNYYTTTDMKSKYCFKIFSLSAKWVKIQLSKEGTLEVLARKAKYLNPEENEYNILIYQELKNSALTPKLVGQPVKVWKTVRSFW